MAAGDLLTVATQAELDAYLVGNGCPVELGPRGIQGLRSLPTVGTEANRVLADGVAAGFDSLGARVVSIDLLIRGYGPDVVDTHIDALLAAWAPTGRTDIELHLMLRGRGHVYLTGRPRGVTESVTGNENVGIYRAQATFLATNPTIQVVTP